LLKGKASFFSIRKIIVLLGGGAEGEGGAAALKGNSLCMVEKLLNLFSRKMSELHNIIFIQPASITM